MTALGRIVLACFRHARDPDRLVEQLGACADLLREVLSAPHGAAALAAVMRYVLLVHPAKPELVLRRLRRAVKDDSVKETLMTAGEELMRRGEARGEARGRRVLLVKQLTRRFGPLSDAARAKVDAADVPTLDAWGERLLDAGTLDDVWG